jgi:tetratricopeptide (TPR) repeat protein
MEAPHGPHEGCPDLETIAAYIDGRLEVAPRKAVTAHLSSCEDCYELFSETVRFQKEEGAAARGPEAAVIVSWFRRPVALAGIAASLLAAGLVGVAFLKARPGANDGRSPVFHELVRAVGATRPIEPQLTGGFRFGPYTPPTRGASSLDDDQRQALRSAIGKIEKSHQQADTVEAQAALGVARLLTSDVDDAIANLVEAARRADSRGLPAQVTAEFFSDLAAGYLVRAWPGDVALALNAADEAIHKDPTLAEAHFNRALALERLGPDFVQKAADAWDEAARRETGDSGWADEAINHRDRLRERKPAGRVERWHQESERLFEAARRGDESTVRAVVGDYTQETREYLETIAVPGWAESARKHAPDSTSKLAASLLIARAHTAVTGDPLLTDALLLMSAEMDEQAVETSAKAILDLQKGRERVDALAVEDAMPLLVSAAEGLDRRRNPLGLWARFFLSICHYHTGDKEGSHLLLDSVAPRASAHGYGNLLGRTHWMLGLLESLKGHFVESSAEYAAGLSCFERTREGENTAALHSLIADNLDFLGEFREAWDNRQSAFDGSELVVTQRRRTMILQNASLALGNQGLAAAGLDVQDVTIASLNEASTAATRSQVHLYRAALLKETGREAEARAEMDEARRFAAEIPDSSVRRRTEAEIGSKEGALYCVSAPLLAKNGLDRAIAYFAAERNDVRLIEQFLNRGKAYLNLGERQLAEQDFRDGIDRIERQWDRRLEEQARIALFDHGWDLVAEMVRLKAVVDHAPPRGSSRMGGALSRSRRPERGG